MLTYIIKSSNFMTENIERYRKFICLSNISCVDEAKIKAAMLGLKAYELEEAKKIGEIGDCLLVQYENTMTPFQIVDKRMEDGKLVCILHTFWLIENKPFDAKTNKWKDCSLRRYLNGEFLKKLDPEFVKCMKVEHVHTEDYVTDDLVWIPSHEELGFPDKENMFIPNVGAKCYKFYQSNVEISQNI